MIAVKGKYTFNFRAISLFFALHAKLEKLEKLDEDDFEKLRERRRLTLMKQHAQEQEWRSNGHGRYTELTDQVS
jgi:hypothetical protein